VIVAEELADAERARFLARAAVMLAAAETAAVNIVAALPVSVTARLSIAQFEPTPEPSSNLRIATFPASVTDASVAETREVPDV
jgi:hypothetical protein